MEFSAVNPPGVWYKRLIAYLWHDVTKLLYFGIISYFIEIFTRPPSVNINEIGKRTGQYAVITGGPRGLALGLIKRLVQLDYNIIMGVRDIKNSQKRLTAFAESNRELSFSKIKFLEMDLYSLKSMRKFADNVVRETSRIDLLLCNAAIMKAPYEITVDGYESQFQVNYLSNFLLTHLLLARLKETAVLKRGPCQIIYTSSMFHKLATFNIDELEKPSVYTPFKFYYPSKLYPIMSMLHLQRLLDDKNSNILLYSIHPGMIPTDLWYTGLSYFAGMIGQLTKGMFRTIENAADTILWPTLSPKYQHRGGLYMENGSDNGISQHARNKQNQAILYTKSLKLAGIDKNKFV